MALIFKEIKAKAKTDRDYYCQADNLGKAETKKGGCAVSADKFQEKSKQ